MLDEAAILACSVYVDLNPIRAGLATTPEESAYTSGCNRIQSLREISTKLTSTDQHRLRETSERPDAWLCELTLKETAIEPTSTTAVSAASPPQESASHAGPIATAVADAVGCSQPSADSGPTSGVVAPVEALPRLHVGASDQGFLSIQVEHNVMLLDWTGRKLRADKRGAIPDHLAPIVDRLGINRSNWVETVRGFGRLFKQAAGRPSSLLEAASRHARGGWFQGKIAGRIGLCVGHWLEAEPLKRHLNYAFAQRTWPHRALSFPHDDVLIRRTVPLLTSSGQAIPMVVSIGGPQTAFEEL